ncbi:MAG TPA: hypothetical protein VH165_06710 [Kofleriaceae bacterium]|nr:hypothetical protein [Kofleriaceae bacterium]
MRIAVVVSQILVVIALLAGTAAAQPGAAPATLPAMPLPAEPPPPSATSEAAVDPSTASAISLAVTLASYVAIIAGHNNGAVIGVGALGTLIGPSTGRWYAHASGASGLAIRLAGVGATIGGVALAFHDCPLFGDHCDASLEGPALVLAGVVAYVGGTIYDIVGASSDARDYNAHLNNVALVPVIHSDQHSYGLAVAAQF